MNTKKITLIIIAVAISVPLIAAAVFFGMGKDQPNATNPEFRKYISAYTSGLLSKTSTIKIKLLSDVVEQIKNKEDLPADLFQFSPKLKGEFYWTDDYTLEFKPEEYMPSGQEYYVEFKLGNLIEVDKDLKSFNFIFNTIKQSYDISFEEHKTVDKKTLQWQQYLGYIQTADYEDVEDIKKILTAEQSGEKLAIHWTADIDKFKYYFTIDSIQRKKKASEVVIKWNGSKIGVDKSGDEKLQIPAIDDFKMLTAKVIQTPEQYLQIQFSDPLEADQNLKGLVSIKNIENLRYVVEDNLIKVYPPNHLDGVYEVAISTGVKNILGYKLKTPKQFEMAFEKIKPAVKLVNKGNILPSSDRGLIFPFEAVNLKAVDVTIIKVYEDNVLQFLQVNDYDDDRELVRVGEPILRKTVSLLDQNIIDYGKWNRFSLDLSNYITPEPGSIYRISIGFRQQHSIYDCNTDGEQQVFEETDLSETELDWQPAGETSYWDYYNGYDYWDYWDNKDNPCHGAYYSKEHTVSQNIIASNLGIICKKSNNDDLKIIVNDLLTTEPMEAVTVEIYNYQNQLLTTTKTDNNGICNIEALDKPYFIVAKQDKQKGYLKINDGSAVSLSQFDISGVAVKEGIKGYIYGERGVWRPGDSIYLTFILKEEDKPLPDDHPIVFEFKNPQNQLISTKTAVKNENGFYTFPVATATDAVTGNYNASVSVGGAKFNKRIKVETIKPNRLKINLNFKNEFIEEGDKITGNLDVKWLHGAIAKNLKATVDVSVKKVKTSFAKYPEYAFDDVTKTLETDLSNVFDAKIDSEGKANFDVEINAENAPGFLNATFITKVFEEGGNFSINQKTVPYYPYQSYIGVKLPKGDKMRSMILTDIDHEINVVILDKDGNPVKDNREIEMEFYKIQWQWWWDENDGIGNYFTSDYSTRLNFEKVKTKNGIANWKIRVNYPDWGRYLVRAYDPISGHSSSKIVFIDWPGWAGKAQREGTSANTLSFEADKDKYNVGDMITLSIPSPSKGRALISIETGNEVLNDFWIETKEGTTEFSFKADELMAPNIYVHVSLLQAHAQTANDLPIRLYGVMPILVEDPNTHLNPVLDMPDKLESETTVAIKVSEKDKKKMTYTIAIVDEGLLDLTNFKTPNAWNEFYAREALGVKTWDIYDWVIGAYGGEIERLISIGGDGEIEGRKKKEASRFKPVAIFLGPFEYDGTTNIHYVEIPKYIGSVRTMIVAGDEIAYGSTEKATPVIKPLMLLGTLPRVLSPGEKVKLPISVFAMEKNIKNVSITVNTNDYLKINGEKSKTITFDEIGDQLVEFELDVTQKLGIGRVEIIATSGSEKASFDIEIDVRNPNPAITKITSQAVAKSGSWEQTFKPIGIEGTNKAILEISTIMPINLDKRLKYLIKYPYGCIEQTTSSVFPQLYLADIIELTGAQKQSSEQNIKAAIDKLVDFQLLNGGLGYWSNSTNVSEWGTNYAGHFLLEAQNKGYAVSVSFMKNWKAYQKRKARNWTDDGDRSQFVQAYRLYTLALAGETVSSAMNRLKETEGLSDKAKWYLAAAYNLSGKKKVAEDLISGLSTYVPEYKELSYTYGSDIRDRAIILQTLTQLDKQTEAFAIVKDISEVLSSNKWLSTQTVAYSLVAVSNYYKKHKPNQGIKFAYTFNGKTETKNSNSGIFKVDIDLNSLNEQTIKFENKANGTLYARLILEGVPELGTVQAVSNNLQVSVNYKLSNGTIVQPDQIAQGTDFVAEVKVKNPSSYNYKEMALAQIFPSGWEILNARLFNFGNLGQSSPYTYQDIRDDRVYTHFDIKKGETKTFNILLNASYAGDFYLPGVFAEAMYDGAINARTSGKWIKVN